MARGNSKKQNASRSQGNAVTTGLVDPSDKTGKKLIDESFDKDPKTLKTRVNQDRAKLAKMQKEPLGDEISYPAWVISRLPQACPVSYAGETIMIPARCPKGQLFVRNSRLLGKLPKGVRTVPAPEKMPKKRIK